MISAAVLVAVILFVCLVPVPISRIRGLALVQGNPDVTMRKVLERTAILKQLKVQPGDQVHEGETLAVFRDPELEDKLAAAQNELDKHVQQLEHQLQNQKNQTSDVKQQGNIDGQIAEVTGKR